MFNFNFLTAAKQIICRTSLLAASEAYHTIYRTYLEDDMVELGDAAIFISYKRSKNIDTNEEDKYTTLKIT